MAVQCGGSDRLEDVLTEQYFLELMRDVADDKKVEKIAIYLKVPRTTLLALKKESETDTPLLATKVLMAWRNDTTYDTVEEAKYELAMALRNVGLRRKAKYILSPIDSRSTTPSSRESTTLDVAFLSSTEGAVKEVQHPPHTSDHEPNITPLPQKNKKCSCGVVVCYTVLGVLVAVSLATISTVKYIPGTSNSISPSHVQANDTVELSFSLSTSWLHTLSLSIDTECAGVAYTYHGKCSSLYSTARVCYQTMERTTPIVNYLLPGSQIKFYIGPNYDCHTNIWVIWNPDFMNDKNFSMIDCDNPPGKTKCFQPLVNQYQLTYIIFNVTEPAYYTHMYSPFPPLSCNLTRYYNICTYNVSRLGEIANAVSQHSIQSDLVPVDILYKPYTFDDVCIIFHVKNENYDCRYSDGGGLLHAQMTRRQDVILFPGLLVGISVVLLLGMIVIHVSYVVREKIRLGRSQYQKLGNMND